MTETNIRRLVIVTRQPRALEVRRTYASANLARFALREREEDYSSYASEEELLLQGLETVKSAIYELGHILEIDRSLLPTTRFHQDDIFVAVGQDGLVANILRYAGELPVIGINPDPARYEGTLLPFEPSDAAQAVLGTIDASLPVQRVTLAEGLFSSGIRILAANDIYIGKFDHSSALYRIQLSSRTERQSSSGILISTPMGATAWERSIVTGAAAVVRAITGRQLAITVKPTSGCWKAVVLGTRAVA
jgi:NAD kinase